MRRLTLTLTFMLTCGNAPAAEHWFAQDGDTLWHGKKRVHLLGIDAPELSQMCLDGAGKPWPCGKYARDYIGRLIASGDVSCTIEGKDRYHNDIGVCFVGGIDLGRDLVKHDRGRRQISAAIPCRRTRSAHGQTSLVGRAIY